MHARLPTQELQAVNSPAIALCALHSWPCAAARAAALSVLCSSLTTVHAAEAQEWSDWLGRIHASSL